MSDFTTIQSKVSKVLAEFNVELARCNDIFRLNHILFQMEKFIKEQHHETDELIKSVNEDWLKK